MPILRLLAAALMAVFALVAGFFAALVVALTALVGLITLRVQRRRRAPSPSKDAPPPRSSPRHGAIDIEAEEVNTPRSEQSLR